MLRLLTLLGLLVLSSGIDADGFIGAKRADGSEAKTRYRILLEGAQDAPTMQKNDWVKVHAILRLGDQLRKKIWSTKDKGGELFQYKVEGGDNIAGWELGTKGMRLGEVRALKIPSKEGYGAQGKPPTIPPNADLLFEIELLEIERKDKVIGKVVANTKDLSEQRLPPSCSPATPDVCSDSDKAYLEKFSKMPSSDLEAAIKDKDDALEKLEKDYKGFIEDLKKRYSAAEKNNAADFQAISDGLDKEYEDAKKKYDNNLGVMKEENAGLSVMKAVARHRKSTKAEL